MGLITSIKNFFNERAENGRDLIAIAKATHIHDIGAILERADTRITKYKLQPITQGSRPRDETFFESGLGALRNAARQRAVSIGLDELSLKNGYRLLVDLSRELDETIGSITRDQMTRNSAFSVLASASIQSCHEKINQFTATWAQQPEHVKNAAPAITTMKNPNSDQKIASDGFMDLVGVIASLDVFNISSRARIKDGFKGLQKTVDGAIAQMENISLSHLAQRAPSTVTRVLSAVVRDKPAAKPVIAPGA